MSEKQKRVKAAVPPPEGERSMPRVKAGTAAAASGAAPPKAPAKKAAKK